MLVISKLSVLASLDSAYSFFETYQEGDKQYYLYNATSVSNLAPAVSQEYFDEEFNYYLKGASYIVSGHSLEECFNQVDSILDLQRQVFSLIPSAEFMPVRLYGIDMNKTEYLFAFEFKSVTDDNKILYPYIRVSSLGHFDWYYKFEGDRWEGRFHCLSELIKEFN